MLNYWKRTNMLTIIKPQINPWNSFKCYHANFINFSHQDATKFTTSSLKYCYSTFSKKNASNTQNKVKMTEKKHNSNSEYKNNSSAKGKQEKYNKEKGNTRNNNSKQQSNKNQSQKSQNIESNQQRQQQKYEMSPDILQFNTEVTTFINSHITQSQFKSPSQSSKTEQQTIPQQKKQIIKITTNFLSNLYKFIILKSEFLEIDPQRSLSPQNRKKIEELIRGKERQVQSGGLGQLAKNEQLLLTYHQELCNTMYLCSMISEKKRFGNVVGEFLDWLGKRERSNQGGKEIRLRFIMSEEELQKSSNNNNPYPQQTASINLPIIVRKLFPPTLYLLHDTLPLDIIKAIAENSSTEQLLVSLRCLAKLLTIKQLKTLDGLIDDKFLSVTEYWMAKKYQPIREVQLFNSAGDASNDKSMKSKVLTMVQLSRLASILSQLNLNGSSIQRCQRILSLILQKQSQTLTQVQQTLTQQFSCLQTVQTTKSLSQLTLSFVINLPPTQIKFDMLIKFYIALAQIGAVDQEFGYLVERVIVGRFVLGDVVERNKEIIRDINVWRELTNRYCINSKEVSILLSTMHKFKKGTEMIMAEKYKDDTQKDSTSQSNRLQHQLTNIWLELYNYYTKESNSNSLPQQFAFPILSGLYRSYGPMVVSQLSECYEKGQMGRKKAEYLVERLQRVDGVIGKLSMKLYEADKSLGYVQQLQLEKLIQLAIVINFSANIEILNTINKRRVWLDKNSNNKINKQSTSQSAKYFNIKINLSYELINKLLQLLTKRLQKVENEHQFPSYEQQHLNDDTKRSNPKRGQYQQQLISPQLQKQQKSIQFLLRFYLLMTKAKLQLFKSNSRNNNKNLHQTLQLILKDIKSTLKKSKINEQTSQLITLMVKNDIKLGNYLKGDQFQKQQPTKNNHQLIDVSQLLQQFANNMQSFIGFGNEKQILEYQNQLQSNLVKVIFPYLEDQAQQGAISVVSKRFIGTSNDLGKQHFYPQKLLINNNMLQQQIMRISLIHGEEDYKMYSAHHVDIANSSNQLDQ